MLARASQKPSPAVVDLALSDATRLDFPDGSFHAALLSLIVTVVPDGRRAVTEALRVVTPGGRVVIFDKFLPDGRKPGPLRRLLGFVLRRVATDPNLRVVDVLYEASRLVILDQPVFLGGQYRIVVLRKPDPAAGA